MAKNEFTAAFAASPHGSYRRSSGQLGGRCRRRRPFSSRAASRKALWGRQVVISSARARPEANQAGKNGGRLRYFFILLLWPSTTFFSNGAPPSTQVNSEPTSPLFPSTFVLCARYFYRKANLFRSREELGKDFLVFFVHRHQFLIQLRA
jgi:hypothetical protein